MCGIFMDREQLAERFAEAASMPRDVVMGASVITITGRNEICIENYRGILEYTDLLIRVQTKSGQIRLSGKNLQIEYYTNDEMKITGRIVQLECQQRGWRNSYDRGNHCTVGDRQVSSGNAAVS